MDGVRIVIVGTSGSGKTTVARQAAQRLGVTPVELDSIRHRENWYELPDGEFRESIAGIVAGDRWVIDGNYSFTWDITMPRATQVVWLDLPRSVVMTQVIWRSLCRAALRLELWNGNRETFSSWLRADHPIRWAWATHHDRQNKFAQKMTSNWIRLRSRREIRQWLDALGKSATS